MNYANKKECTVGKWISWMKKNCARTCRIKKCEDSRKKAKNKVAEEKDYMHQIKSYYNVKNKVCQKYTGLLE